MLTKKHFEGVARVIRGKVIGCPKDSDRYAQAYTIAYDLAVMFKDENDRFDHDRFMEACGFDV